MTKRLSSDKKNLLILLEILPHTFFPKLLKYIDCPIISETALRADRERDLTANHGTTCIPRSITDTTSHQ